MILVTGGNGRLGKALADRLSTASKVRVAVRQRMRLREGDAEQFEVGPIDACTDWSRALAGASHVVHCAALTRLAPGMDEAQFDVVNAGGVRNLASQAAEAGVKRVVLVSSITVNGKHSNGSPFHPDDVPDPQSAYSRSKLAGETALREVAGTTGMEFCIVRSPRIVWPTLDGNLAQLGSLIRKGIPLPFGNLTTNRRASLSSNRLLAGLEAALFSSRAGNRVLLLSDPDPLSTVQMLKRVGNSVGTRPRLFAVPGWALRAAARCAPASLLGHLDARGMIDELTRDLRIDSTESWMALEIDPSTLD